jgi:hypothetical protein
MHFFEKNVSSEEAFNLHWHLVSGSTPVTAVQHTLISGNYISWNCSPTGLVFSFECWARILYVIVVVVASWRNWFHVTFIVCSIRVFVTLYSTSTKGKGWCISIPACFQHTKLAWKLFCSFFFMIYFIIILYIFCFQVVPFILLVYWYIYSFLKLLIRI